MAEQTFKPPQDIIDREEKQYERAERFLRARKMRLADSKIQRIERDVAKKIDSWKTSTNPLRKRLARWNDMLEGVVEETNFPFQGASNITLHYCAGMARTFRASFNKTMYQDEDLFVPYLDPDFNLDRPTFAALQDGFNYSFSTLYNGLETLKDATLPVVRDGTVIVMASWERELEKSADQRIYRDAEGFAKDYPNAEAAGCTEEEYKNVMDAWIINPDEELIVFFDYDFVKFDGIRYRINSFAKFIFYPVFAKRIPDMEMYGNEYTLSESQLRVKLKRGEMYEDGVKKALGQKGTSQTDEWDRARTFIEGINTNSESYKPIRVADLVYKTDLDGDGIPEKYLLTFALDSRSLLSISHYDVRRNIDIAVAFRIIARENRFPGVSLVGDTEDLFMQMDVLHRHRNNIRMLVASPVFLANSQYKETIDMGRAENVIRPGLTLWVEDLDKSIKQLLIQNLDQPGNSMDEEQVIERHVELAWGPTQGMSGGQTTQDPRAPARKTQMLLTQANMRIDDYMDEFRSSYTELADLHAALLYQYYSGKEFTFDKDNKVFKFPIELLASPKIHWKAKRRSMNLTPEFAMARMSSLVMIYAQLLPRLSMNDPLAIEMWNRQILNSGEPEAEKLLWDPQNMAQIQQQVQQMQQAQQENEISHKAKIHGKSAFAGEIGKAVGKKMGQLTTGEPANPPSAQIPTPAGA